MIRYVPLGDSAITVVLGDSISRSLSDEVLRITNELRAAPLEAVNEVVPSYASLSIFYDPLRAGFTELLAEVRSVVERPRAAQPDLELKKAKTVRIPVRYDGEDLAEVADRTGHSPAEVIALHSAREYYVYVIGFVPGFAYLGELDPSLVLPRRSAPRKRVPAGSVAIAEAQTGVYPFATPGGWHLIGRTTVRMFDSQRAEPALLRVGDRVAFEPES
jgi:KipI family sensor histidine kinase inhibitor